MTPVSSGALWQVPADRLHFVGHGALTDIVRQFGGRNPLAPQRGKADGKEKESQRTAKGEGTENQAGIAGDGAGAARLRGASAGDANGGWHFQIIEVAGLNSGTLQRRANLLAEELRQLYDLKE